MVNVLQQFIISVRQVIFPSKCLSCKRLFSVSEKDSSAESTFGTLMHPHLCSACRIRFTQVKSPFCSSCGMMFRERVSDDHLCGNCIKKKPASRLIRSFGIYDKVLLDLIRAYKFRNKLQLARPFSILLYDLYKNTYWDTGKKEWCRHSPDLIIPVPLHISRFRKRKFNQAWLMIKHWNSNKSDYSILLRNRATKPQTGLDKKHRKQNIKGAFSVSCPEKVKDKKILLVDDVYTTGATVDECTKVLLKNGARHVDVLTIARTQAA